MFEFQQYASTVCGHINKSNRKARQRQEKAYAMQSWLVKKSTIFNDLQHQPVLEVMKKRAYEAYVILGHYPNHSPKTLLVNRFIDEYKRSKQ